MTITLNSLTTIGHPDPKILFRVYRNSWRIFTYHSKDHDYYKIAAEVIRKDKKYINDHRNLLTNLGNRCESGLPLTTMYDEKELHEICKAKCSNLKSELKIFRIRKNDLRLIFIYYPPNKEIILLDLLIKKKDKYSNGELDKIRRIACSIFTDDDIKKELNVDDNYGEQLT